MLMFKQILPTITIKKQEDNSKENMNVDNAQRGKGNS